MSEFQAIGLSHKDTPIELRERIFFEKGEEASEFLLKLSDVFGITEGLVVSTCNRTEIYYSSEKKVSEKIIKYISYVKGVDSNLLRHYFSVFNSDDAVNRLFRVSLGLESRILGDIQISNQVKEAYRLSADLNLAGPLLHRLMHIPRIDKPKIALIGLGEIGKHILENLKSGHIKLTLANRTKSKADSLALRMNADVADFGALHRIIEDHDVIISAVAVKAPIILPSHIQRENTQKLFIDLSVPRSIDPMLGAIPGIALYNADQLEERTLKIKKTREQAVPDVERIIADSVESFKNWKNEMEVSPAIRKLKNALETIRREELARHLKLEEKERELLDTVTKNMMQKIIRLPVLELKAACRRGEAETLVEVLNDLFNLEQQEEEKK